MSKATPYREWLFTFKGPNYLSPKRFSEDINNDEHKYQFDSSKSHIQLADELASAYDDGMLTIVKLLLQKGVNPTISSPGYECMLSMVMSDYDKDTLQKMIDNKQIPIDCGSSEFILQSWSDSFSSMGIMLMKYYYDLESVKPPN